MPGLAITLPPTAGEDASVMIPAFAPNDKCSLKGSALYLTLAAGYSGKAALEQHEVVEIAAGGGTSLVRTAP